MKRALISILLLAPLALNAPLAAAQQHAPSGHKSAANDAIPPETAVKTQHSVTIDGKTIHYTATAGTLLLRNRKHDVIGSMFYIAYTANGANADHRPVTFAYNGGPGSASALVNIGGFGPMRVVWPTPGNVKNAVQPPYRMVPNEYSILKSTDIVFVDAMGTGYSRIVAKGNPKDFFGVSEDARAFSQFIQRYITVNQRWNSPKFLLGESYGTTRSAVLANDLVSAGVNLNGVILSSTGLDFHTIDNAPGNDLPYVSYLPSYAAIAWYHHRLNPMPPDLATFVKKVEAFAGTTYARALFEGSALPRAKKQQLAAQLAGYTGLPASLWLKADLRVTLAVFRRNVMGNNTMTGRYDERFTTPELQPVQQHQGYGNEGATTRVFNGGLTTSMNRYLHDDLNYKTSYPYLQSSYQAFGRWDWNYRPPMSGGDMGFGAGSKTCCGTNVAPALTRAMVNNPGMQVMFASGYYDTATPFFGTDYTVRHMRLPPAIRKNVHMRYYPVGHMLYLNLKALPKIDHDIDAFITAASQH